MGQKNQPPCYGNVIVHQTLSRAGYVLLDQINQGKFGRIWNARDEEGELVAVKLIKKEDRRIHNCVLNEIYCLNKSFPFCLSLIAAYQDPANYYIITKLCRISLHQLVANHRNAQQGRINELTIRKYARQLAEAIQFLHHDKNNSQRYKTR